MQNQKKIPMKEMKETLLGESPIRIKRNLGRVAIALLLTSVAVTCSLTMRASPTAQRTADMSKTSTLGTSLDMTGREPTNPLGTTEPTIAPPFDSNYSFVSVGYPVGVQTYYGGLTFKYDDPNTLLIGGAAGSGVGRIYQITVNRDA